MKSVFQKEISQFFHSMMGYVYLSIFLLISGAYFVAGNLLTASGDIRDYFSSLITIIMLMTPMLTMRAFAEEKKQRTDQLLLLSPQSSLSITLGKFLAILVVFVVGLAGPALHIALLAYLGSFDAMVVTGNLIGLAAAAAAFISIGLLISAMTENQIVACVVTYAVLLGLWLAGFAAGYLSSPILRQLFFAVSPLIRFTNFAQGIFSLSSLFYYLSVTVFFLYLSVIRFDSQRRM